MQQPIFHPTTELSNEDKVATWLKTISSTILVLTCGLFPLIFLPLPVLAVGYTKYLILVAGVVLAIIFYSLSILREGKFSLELQWGVLAFWLIAIVATVSALFSGDTKDALLSDGFSSGSAIFLAVMAMVVSAGVILRHSKKTVLRLYALLAASALVIALFHIFRAIFGADTLVSRYFTSATASPIGDWNSLGIFFGLVIILCLITLEQLALNKTGKLLIVGLAILSLGVLALVNFKIVWYLLLVVSFMLLLYSLVRHRFTDPQLRIVNESTDSIYTIVISLVILIASAGFVLGGSVIGSYVSEQTGISYVEVRPSTSATIDIARNVLKEDLILGIGPNRFVDAWRLYKNPAINETIFWSSNFEVGSSYFLTNLIQTGLLGIVAWVIFFVLLLMSGARLLLKTLRVDSFWYFVGISSLVASVYLWGLSFFYVPHPVMLLITAICTSVFFAAYGVLVPGKVYQVSIEQHRNFGFVLIAFVVAVSVFSASGFYVIGKQFAGNLKFNQALNSVEPGDTLESLEVKIAEAYALNNSDLYARQLAVYQLLQLNSLVSVPQPTEVEQSAFERAAVNGRQAITFATSLDGTDPINWQVYGQIHSLLVQVGLGEAYDLARDAYDKAMKLDPVNPVLPLLRAELEVRNNNPTEARKFAEASLALRPAYTEAAYLLVQLDILEGKTNEAIARTQNLIRLEPQDSVRWYQLGVLNATANKIDDAIAAFEQAVKLNPQYANARYFLALGYYEKGEAEKSLQQLDVVKGLNPDNQALDTIIGQIKSGQPLANNIGEANPVQETSENNNGPEDISTDDVESDLITSVNNIPEQNESTEATPTEDEANEDIVTEPVN